MPRISIVCPCYNEEGNLEELYTRIEAVMAKLPAYDYEYIFIDNASTDGSAAVLRKLAEQDKRVRVIFNTRNFGHVRSPYYGLLQSQRDAAIILATDLQDPPELIPQFLEQWKAGSKIVMGVKTASEETPAMWLVRKLYYDLLARLTSIKIVKNATGFGLYDRAVLNTLRKIDDPYPYFRGLVSELGYPPATVSYLQPLRKRGITSNNFYSLYDLAMFGITNHSKAPLRLATMAGFAMAVLNLLIALGYFVAKLLFWDTFTMGVAPIVIGIFFVGSVQLFFIGIIGEYIGAIYTQVLKRPLVVERERLNFD